MKIVLIAGSPHVHGSTNLLADGYARGAKEAGHTVVRFDAARMDISPCIGCDRCGKGKHTCVFQDDMELIYPHLRDADCVVLATPLYFFSMSAQLKRAGIASMPSSFH